MGQFFNGLLTFGAVCAVAFLCLTLPAVATPPPIRIRQRPPSRRMTTKMIPPNPRRKGTTPTRPRTKANPMWPPPPDAKAEDAPPAATGEIQSAVKMKDLLAEGFLIRTTVLVPTDAVTPPARQGVPGCHYPDPAKRDGDRGLLLHAQGICEGEPDRYRLLHRVPLGDAGHALAHDQRE
jgi:hypothetical protein